MLPRLHLVVGLLALLIFLVTGQLMERHYGVPAMESSARAIYRSSHLYIFYAAAFNVAIGLYYRPVARPGLLAWLNGILVMASPIILIASFFVEAKLAHLDRTGVFLGAILILVGMGNTLLGRIWLCWRAR